MKRRHLSVTLIAAVLFAAPAVAGSRLLFQPTLSATQIAFAHGGDLWVVERAGGEATRLTSTPAVESDPHFSPDGTLLAFTSDRSGVEQVYVVAVEGGEPLRLTWYPAESHARGWTPDGSRVLYSSSRETAPVGYQRLWTVAPGGGPSTLLPAPWGFAGMYSPDGGSIVVDRVSRWDSEWRHYRGGQNTPLTILDLDTLDEAGIPCERTTDIKPVWLGGTIYFLSDRDWAMNVWAYDVAGGSLRQVTEFPDGDVKSLGGYDGTLVFERDGWIHTLDPATGHVQRVDITVRGDYPWEETRWEDVADRIASSALSPTGQRALFEARGEIFTVPADKGDARNLTNSSGAADRAPVWSPKGDRVAWVSDDGSGYVLLVGTQDGLGQPRRLSIGESKMAWETTWSPDGTRIAFVDDDVRVRVVDVDSGEIVTADVGGVNIERGDLGLTWSPDSKWLAYSRTAPNQFRRITVWSRETGETHPLTDAMADAQSPAWDRGGKYLYFLASTDVGLGSGWANTSRIGADPTYGVYVAVLATDEPSPFPPESDEEPTADQSRNGTKKDGGKKGKKKAKDDEDKKADGEEKEDKPVEVRIDVDGIERRTLALPMPVARYRFTVAGPAGTLFVGEAVPDGEGATLHSFSMKEREAKEFAHGVSAVSVSADGAKLLYRGGGESWFVVGTEAPPPPDTKPIKVSLRMKLDRTEEWRQIFEEAWHYERDFFYDPNMHGGDWDEVLRRYEPLVSHVHHRADLNVVLDRMNGELSVGHSFVFGGDMPDTGTPAVGLLGADFERADGGWRISRIYSSESWNPSIEAPLDRPGLKVAEGDWLVGVNGVPLTDDDDPYRLLDGTAGRQTVLHVNDRPGMEGAHTITVEPVAREGALRQRAWVEDNRRRVDELSGGRLAYVWVPNTGQPGMISFDRYFFAQQDRDGAVIDERFNRGGLLDDHMVDLMTRHLRAAVTNEVPGGIPFRLPAGILGPKVLLINELAGSGGDYFPWVFRRQQAGPLIGTRTWGGLVSSAVHYAFVDGGAMTAPVNAVFDPIDHHWIAENQGVPPDIEVRLDARSVAAGRDPQLERGVAEALRLLEADPPVEVAPPPFSTPAARPARRVAVTVDDLPCNAAECPSAERQVDVNRRLVSTLVERDIPAVGFVNERKLERDGAVDPARVAALEVWLEAGLELGNHTYSHPSLNRTPLDEWLRDVERGEPVTRRLLGEHGKRLRWFRYPFLQTGRDLETKHAAEAALAEDGLRNAPVTIDNSEWIFARAYLQADEAGDEPGKRRIVAAYVDYMEAKTDYYERQSRALFDREIPQVLLVHANRLNADHFDLIADMLARRGYRFVPLADAVDDAAYESADTFTGAAGITWLHRWALSREPRGPIVADEPRTPPWIMAAADVDSE